ncbi:MAG: adenylate/guanylate cyclase domain-containing protein [Deltaproteobacteria bacterium]|nr:adenylate/guanylate cyclase domain-containing protein [Deltaproteobacteria bacterium]
MRQVEQREDVAAPERADAMAGEWRRESPALPMGPSSNLRRRLGSSPIPANLAGAIVVYLYFTFVDPLAANPTPNMLRPFLVFLAVTTTLLFANWYVGRRFLAPLGAWRRRLRSGADATRVPDAIRRRALNAPLANALLSALGWTLAGVFYFPYLAWAGVPVSENVRTFVGIVFVGGPITSALAFLLSEFHWRQEIPVFFPYGRIERAGALRVPILLRLGGTFLVTSVMPIVLMLMADLTLVRRLGPAISADVRTLLRAQLYIVGATGVTSLAMAFLVARFINRPIQALRTAMARVALGDLATRVPVRSTDELGELNEHFNTMVEDLREGERLRELFGRYVSPAVARAALERGIALGGEVVHATAMFVDLRGFTAMTGRATPAHVVEVLNEYYAIVERVCERHGGVVTQFLGDGVVIVFGGPLHPQADHALQAVRAAIALQHTLAARNGTHVGEPLEAGIGICTGDMIAGNVGAGDRITYTIVGDAVNQAARLQVKTRELGTSILLTESTRQALGLAQGIPLRARGAVALKGIAAPVEIYSVDT